VDPSNIDTARGWDGPIGEFWADNVDATDAEVARYLPAFLDAVAVPPDGHVLDVGCGAGRTSRELARLAPSGSVTGIDLSTDLLHRARELAAAEGLSNVVFERADAQVADLGAARYDRVVSRNGVMFFGDPVAAFANLARALRPDGRLVLLVWQDMAEQEWFRDLLDAASVGGEVVLPAPGGPGPFSLGDPERVRAILTAAGFAEPELRGVREPMLFGADRAQAERMVLGTMGRRIADFDEAGRAAAEAALRARVAERIGPEGLAYGSAMWIISATLP
jgi:SAM-dependent methyltransferase